MKATPLRVYHFSSGCFRPPFAALTQGGEGGAAMRAAQSWARANYVIHCLLIELPADSSGLADPISVGDDVGAAASRPQFALIDTGLSRADMQRPLQRLGWGMALFGGAASGETAAEAIARIGAGSCPPFTTQDVAHVLLTHLDKDHTGGLVDFPQATVHLHSDALAALQLVQERRAGLVLRERMSLAHFAHGPRWQAIDTPTKPPETAALPVDSADPIPALLAAAFPGTRTLPGLPASILAVPLPGHAPGHCGFALLTAAGWLLHCGDSVYHRGWLDGRRPPMAIQFVEGLLQHNAAGRRGSREALRRLVLDGRIRICSSHDPQAFAELCEPAEPQL